MSDRYLLSSLAYQTLGVERDAVASFNRFAELPDLTIYVDAPIDVAEQRRSVRGGPAEIFEQRALQVRVRDAYLKEVAALRTTGAPLVEIDGTAPIDAVFAGVLAAVQTCIAGPVGQK